MVEDSGKTAGAGSYQPVNLPEPVIVEEDVTGLPKVIKTRPRQIVLSVEDRWRIDDEWWRSQPVSRIYFSVLLKSGQRRTLFKDIIGGGWYKQG